MLPDYYAYSCRCLFVLVYMSVADKGSSKKALFTCLLNPNFNVQGCISIDVSLHTCDQEFIGELVACVVYCS